MTCTINIQELIEDINALRMTKFATDISGITADSRQVSPGSLFAAIVGYEQDGHTYIRSAVERGAAAVLYSNEDFSAEIPDGVAAIRVPDTRLALGIIADRFYDHPSRDLTLVAVTGTNGKTTTVNLLDAIFAAAGHTTATIGTLGATIAGKHIPGDRTTPDAVELQALLAQMRDSGVTHAAMEISSHALDLHRAYHTSFAAATFTNLSQDHLDWHETMEKYFDAKSVLFTDYTHFNPNMVAAINIDDPWGARLANIATCSVTSSAVDAAADIRATNVKLSPTGTTFTLQTPTGSTLITTRLVGRFNVYNALSAASTCYALGISLENIAAGLAEVTRVDGRFEPVDVGQPFAVLVDYAHTPEAIENVLQAARSLGPTRLICVFGAGGDRDRTKRPRMATAACAYADMCVITSDNPRSEKPENIIADVIAGATEGTYKTITDRAEAITYAMSIAKPGDVIVIAGKGHETYQEFADGRIDFDDRAVATQALRELGYGRTNPA